VKSASPVLDSETLSSEEATRLLSALQSELVGVKAALGETERMSSAA
jgi:hypothetical protein